MEKELKIVETKPKSLDYDWNKFSVIISVDDTIVSKRSVGANFATLMRVKY